MSIVCMFPPCSQAQRAAKDEMLSYSDRRASRPPTSEMGNPWKTL